MQEEGGLDGLECKDVLLDLLEQCGSDIPISVSVKQHATPLCSPSQSQA